MSAGMIPPATSRKPASPPTSSIPMPSVGLLQRECAECKESDEERGLQRLAASSGGPAIAPPIVHEVLQSSGQPLDAGTRASMEPRFGHDFSKVRVHTDARAEQSARAVAAHAYTVGNNVVFGPGRYAPGTQAGRKLLAHELTHVVQQGPRSPSRQLTIGPTSDPYEQQADRLADEVASRGVPSSEDASSLGIIATGRPTIQRDASSDDYQQGYQDGLKGDDSHALPRDGDALTDYNEGYAKGRYDFSQQTSSVGGQGQDASGGAPAPVPSSAGSLVPADPQTPDSPPAAEPSPVSETPTVAPSGDQTPQTPQSGPTPSGSSDPASSDPTPASVPAMQTVPGMFQATESANDNSYDPVPAVFKLTPSLESGADGARLRLEATGRAGDPLGARPGLELKYPAGSEIGLPGMDRWHLVGPGIGGDDGIMYAPHNFNVSDTAVVENLIRRAREVARVEGGDVEFDFTAVGRVLGEYEGVTIAVLEEVNWNVTYRSAGSDQSQTLVDMGASLGPPPISSLPAASPNSSASGSQDLSSEPPAPDSPAEPPSSVSPGEEPVTPPTAPASPTEAPESPATSPGEAPSSSPPIEEPVAPPTAPSSPVEVPESPGASAANAAANLAGVVLQYLDILASNRQLASKYAYKNAFFREIGGQAQQYQYDSGEVLTVYSPPDYAALTAYLTRKVTTIAAFNQFVGEAAIADLAIRNDRWSFDLGNDDKGQPVYYDVDPVISAARNRVGAGADDQYAQRRGAGTREVGFKSSVDPGDRHVYSLQVDSLFGLLRPLDGDAGVDADARFFVVGETDARRGSLISHHFYLVEAANQVAAVALLDQSQGLVRSDFTE